MFRTDVRRSFKHLFRAVKRDPFNRLFYGSICPLYAQLIYVDASECDLMLPSEFFRDFYRVRLRSASGLVVKRWPSEYVAPIAEDEKNEYCLRHWRDGLSWKDAGAYDYLLQKIAESTRGVYDECASFEDVMRRFDALDRLFEHASQYGLALRQDLLVGNFREVGGSIVHLGPDGVPCFGGAGYHRFAIAKILNIRFPAQVGCVHISALNRVSKFYLPGCEK
jgi:hypothetical protein